ncbi:hypothetical protein ACFWB0_24545 [Rhodococcus sp. NPDC060086]|uniref:hypothetical protein n=1 Tax=Rhodococcus sp. NPDC060086 TaxID=3347055 RepID=UPI00365D820C
MTRILPWVATAALALAVLLAGVLNPVRPASVRTDALGPDNGEPVQDYLGRAGVSLGERGPEPSWALVSFVEPVDVAAVAALPGDLRVARVLFRVPIDRVQTPLVTVAVSAHPEALRRAPIVAAGRLRGPAAGHDRAARIAAVSADRLAADCACAVGIVVRGTGEQLREVATASQVRAVEALPSDAVAGRFSVRPLLPEHIETVAPGPDDGQP